MQPISTREQFWDHVNCDTDDQCWEWNHNKNESGYGEFSVGGKHIRAHRFAYELEIGIIPKHYEVHHKCENRACVNPHHLQAVTRQEHTNISRNHVKFRTHCPEGHEYTLENTKFEKPFGRKCKICIGEIQRRYRSEHREEIKIYQKELYLQQRESRRLKNHQYYLLRKNKLN